MTLTVKLFATFRTGRFEVANLEVAPGSTLGDVVDGLAIGREQVGILLVRGRHAALEHVPAAGDSVSIFPLVGGG
jgi:molybdopterin converting factor small subunit